MAKKQNVPVVVLEAVEAADVLDGVLQIADTAALLAVACGRVDMKVLVLQAIASRGISNETGQWIGFDAAARQCWLAGGGDVVAVNKSRTARLC